MGESRGGVKRRETGEGACLVRVEEAAGPGEKGEAGGSDTFHNFGEGL